MILEESRQGPLTARIDNRFLHSRYSPQKEAVQFFDRWEKENPGFSKLIIIEPGLGYILNPALKKIEAEDIFVIFLSSHTMNYCKKSGSLDGIKNILYKESGNDLSELSSFMYSADIKKTAILEWPASIHIFDEKAQLLGKDILKIFQIIQGNQITEKKFSRLWFKKGISNFLRQDYSKVVGKNHAPVILCASGPSLNDYLNDIQKLQDSCIIAALPSSLKSLSMHGIESDIVFSTDPGYYAREHLKYISDKTLVISPLSAESPPFPAPMMGFRQNNPFEHFILKDSELPFFPEMGTVAASAIIFLINWKGSSPLYICGLDLCLKDIRMHASPHSFDPIILEKENRFKPGYSLYFDRASSMTDSIRNGYRFSKSMNTYQNWFSLQNFPSGVYRLAPETVNLNIPVIDKFPHLSGRKSLTIHNNPSYPTLKARKERTASFISTIQKDLLNYKENRELSPQLETFCHALSMDVTEYDTLSLLIEKWKNL